MKHIVAILALVLFLVPCAPAAERSGTVKPHIPAGVSLVPRGMPAPVGAYTFDGNAEDSSGNANHAVVVGAELTEDRAGKPDSAYLFYRQSQYIKLPLTAKNTFGAGSFTASFWVRTSNQSTATRNLLSNDAGSNTLWGFRYTPENKVAFMLKNQEGAFSSISSSPIGDGKWHHVTGTRNAEDGTMSLYVDNTLVATRPAAAGSVNSQGPLYAGDHMNVLFIGRMDDVMLWDRAFRPDELAAFHAAAAAYEPFAAPPHETLPDPVGIYAFTGDAGDESGGQNHAKVTGASLSPDRAGRPDSAYCFSGLAHKIEIPLVPANTFSKGSFTVAFWVKVNQRPTAAVRLVTNYTGSNAAWSFSYMPEGMLSFSIRDKETFYTFVNHPLDTGGWHHVAGVRDAEKKTLSLYVDNRLVGARPYVASDVNSGGSIWVGEHTNMLFMGCIDEVMLWKRALSGAEIGDLHRKSVPFSVPDKERITPIETPRKLNTGKLPRG